MFLFQHFGINHNFAIHQNLALTNNHVLPEDRGAPGSHGAGIMEDNDLRLVVLSSQAADIRQSILFPDVPQYETVYDC